MSEPERLRLLPWAGSDGRRCYLSTDADGSGYVARLADEVEAVQLAMGARLVERASEVLGASGRERRARPNELRCLAYGLVEALRDALRVAESRGGRGDRP
ncbi:hypothetical protein [Streptomyces niger]|uniref:hypothetical protein n=1 Tax=Streptomyces niger TaxID=66373 RepID=UPI0006996543|nr:hypothetical protein [Streptomyces niger]